MAKKNYHVGGQQLPLITPDSSWQPPAELPDLRGRRRLGVDVETKDRMLARGRGAGWPYGDGYVAGVSVAWDRPGGGVEGLYVPVRHPEDNYREPQNVPGWLRDVVSTAGEVVFQNAPYDLGWLGQPPWDLPPPANLRDTIAAAVTVDEERSGYQPYSLDNLCRWRGVPGKDERLLREAASAYGFDAKAELADLPARYVGAYGAQDPASTLLLLDSLRPAMEQEGTLGAYQLECDLIPVVLAMRRRGIRIDTGRAERAAHWLDVARDRVLAELGRRLGGAKPPGGVTIEHCRSWKQLQVWFDAEGVQYYWTRPTRGRPHGQPSFQATWMRRSDHWLPRLVARAEQLTEAADKFIRGYLLGYAHRGRLHAEVNQFRTEEGRGTRTHRFSYSDPPLQQMPMRVEVLALIIRGCFLPEEGAVWCAADYSQQEYRLIVNFAALLGLRGADLAVQRYVDDPSTDFHAYVAELTGLERKPAKDANFAKSYGAGVPKFAAMTGRTEEEAAEIMEVYDRELPFVRLLNQRMSQLAASRGWVKLLDGARCHFEEWEPDRSSRKRLAFAGVPTPSPAPLAMAEQWRDNVAATRGLVVRLERAHTKDGMNKLIQGGAARQTKIAMRDLAREGLLPMIQMHDELGVPVTEERQALRVGEVMRAAGGPLLVPMKVDLEYGRSWGAAKKRPWAEVADLAR